MDVNGIIDRTKLLLGIPSDAELSRYFGKFDSYIAQYRVRKTLDVDLFLDKLSFSDLNWLFLNDMAKMRKIVKHSDENGIDVIDLNEVENQKTLRIKELEEKVRLLESLISALQKK